MSALVLLGESTPLFPYPEDASTLLHLMLGDAVNPGSVPSGRRVVAAPYVAFNAALLQALDAAATTLPARLEVVCSAMTEWTAPLGGAPNTADGKARAYDLFLTAPDAPGATLEELRARATPVRLTLPCAVEEIRTQGMGPAPHVSALPRSAALVAHVQRWPHLLWFGQMWPFAARAAALPAGMLLAGGNVVGNNVRVHPTALVERSVLQDGVEVDAHATVMDSVLGPGVRVADHTAVHHSVLGRECGTLADSFLRRVVALPGSTISNMDLREVLLGSNVFITAGVIFFTGQHGSNARCGQSPETLEDSGHAELGGAVGHKCVLGARAIFEPGRALPGGVIIVMRPEEGVLNIPQDVPPGTLLAWDNAALVEVSQRWPGYLPPEVD
jgi:carbonic anhydrase/acetyltransferase-like protein (isoleucine patch superfamily)